MAESIHIDFKQLDTEIEALQALLNTLDEPSYKKLEFWAGDATGSGFILTCLYHFCNSTIDYHNAVYALIQNTIAYLQEVKKVKDADQDIADRL